MANPRFTLFATIPTPAPNGESSFLEGLNGLTLFKGEFVPLKAHLLFKKDDTLQKILGIRIKAYSRGF